MKYRALPVQAQRSIQNSVAMAITLILILVCAVAYPYATNQGPKGFLFFFISTSLASFAALMTAYLLLGQFLGTHRPSLAVLGGTYLFVGLINIPYLMMSPDLYKNEAFFNATPYASIWLWIFSQVSYPLGILLYIFIDRRYRIIQISPRSAKYLLLFLLTIIPILIIFLSFICINTYSILPPVAGGSPELPLFIIPSEYSSSV